MNYTLTKVENPKNVIEIIAEWDMNDGDIIPTTTVMDMDEFDFGPWLVIRKYEGKSYCDFEDDYFDFWDMLYKREGMVNGEETDYWPVIEDAYYTISPSFEDLDPGILNSLNFYFYDGDGVKYKMEFND